MHSHESQITCDQTEITGHQNEITCHQNEITCHQNEITRDQNGIPRDQSSFILVSVITAAGMDSDHCLQIPFSNSRSTAAGGVLSCLKPCLQDPVCAAHLGSALHMRLLPVPFASVSMAKRIIVPPSSCLHAADAALQTAGASDWVYPTSFKTLQGRPPAYAAGSIPPMHQSTVPGSLTTAVPAHAPPQASAMPMVPARAPPGTQWGFGLPSVPALTTDQRRRQSAISHRPFGPETGAAAPRGTHRPYTQRGASKGKKEDIKPHRMTFILWPFPMTNTSSAVTSTIEDDEFMELLYPRDARLFAENVWLRTYASQFGLIFTFDVPLGVDGLNAPFVDKDFNFHALFNTALLEHMENENIHFTGSAAPPPFAEPHNVDPNMQQALQVAQYPWVVVKFGIAPSQPHFKRKMTAAAIPWFAFTINHLAQKEYWTSIKDVANEGSLIYFIAPRNGPLAGRLPGALKDSPPHLCFSLRFQDRSGALPPDYSIRCLSDCPVSDTNELGAATASPASPPPGRMSLFEDGAHNSDQEEEQLQQAIALSSESLYRPFPVAGPSRRPLPFPPRTPSPVLPASLILGLSPQRATASIRPRSASTSSTIPAEIISVTYRTVRAWSDGLDRYLGEDTFTINAPSIEAAIPALLAHFESFSTGVPYSGHGTAQAVEIEPKGEFAPFTEDISCKVVLLTALLASGDSVGDGVMRTLLNELVREVFSDKTAWKLQPSRLHRLYTYGYICRLYMALEHALPPQLSVIFAYAVLASEDDVYHDVELRLGMATPDQRDTLSAWPENFEEFNTKVSTNDPKLAALLAQYFECQASTVFCPNAQFLTSFQIGDLKALDSQNQFNSDTFTDMSMTLARLILFGTRNRFMDCADVLAFQRGFDGPISEDPKSRLSLTFGASIRRVLPLMCADHLKSPEEVIARLKWVSTGEEALASVESAYKNGVNRFLRGTGRVHHHLLSDEALNDFEKTIPDDHPLARSLMFLMNLTGSHLLPRSATKAPVSRSKKDGPVFGGIWT
ncbi:hypothetical protein GGX14DRAFT_384076 [Mycena pura]|uniref:Uncharacterized protein n=1 Tax=Mycena pura TaxID=153505 RepID=A0AAD7E668_9AGAR|nr:hypothetical protein GGX14DRAFT_384076 [Mycena pura]